MSPPNGSFEERLRRVMREGNLTVADLARWLERPDATVRGWSRGGHLAGPALDAAYVLAQISRLERMLRKKQGLPVPRMTRAKRIEYLSELKWRNSHER